MFNFLTKIFTPQKPAPLDDQKLKKITKVLIIDDDEPKELRAHLKKEGWNNSYTPDLDSLTNKKLVEAHIVCIDIMGVGEKLQVKDGLELVKYIKSKYPEKKIILYSSTSKQDIFSDSLDLVDKRLRKEASLIPFSSSIEEMARSTLSWDETIIYTYNQIKDLLGDDIDFSTFKIYAEKSLTKNGWSDYKFKKYAGVGLDTASKVATLLSLVVTSAGGS